MSTKRISSFYKIIDSGILQHGSLGLPIKFVRVVGDDLGDVGTLKVPNGAPWPVELKKVDGKIHFQNGWHEFAEYYSISFGYFLAFNYVGSSQFNVAIFDMSGCEISYKLNSVECEEQNHVWRQVPIPARQETVSYRKLDASPNHEEHQSFTVVMKPSYWQYLPIPTKFVKSCFTEAVESVTLVSHGRKWELGCFKDANGYCKLVRGWTKFSKEIDLKKGDICTFRLMSVERGNAVMKFKVDCPTK